MKNYNYKKITFFIFGLFLCLIFLLPKTTLASDVDEMVWGGFHDELQTTTGLGEKDPREMIVGFIRIALGFLGILAITIIMLAGFKWMVSGGNEDATATAKSMMFNGLMGLIIILASMSLASFVINSVLNATQVI
ncbi:MAG: hypothetical protein PF572_00260 [Patescibacteria group bacterium]|jgi:hypothetical protein|nr:hypothetical protein [Patescibacteria group bacterium]